MQSLRPIQLPARDISSRSPSKGRVWVLLSGGVDSAACTALYLNQGFRVRCVHVSFGQAAADPERVAAERVARHFGLSLEVLRWSGNARFRAGETTGRNAFLHLGALLEIGARSGLLASGIHAGTPYFDCSKGFISSLQSLLDGYCDGRMLVAAPFLDWTKDQVFLFCRTEGVPVDLTYSCENGSLPPCGSCVSCRDRRALDAL